MADLALVALLFCTTYCACLEEPDRAFWAGAVA